MKYQFYTLDVLTGSRFGGNPLAVVMDAQDLDGGQMRTVAREFNLSETTFVRPPQDPANTANVRIFTPGAELPFAGHPTIGTAIVLAELAAGGAAEFESEIRLEEQVGLLVVNVSKKAGEPASAQFTNAVLPEPKRPAPGTAELAAALSLDAADITGAAHRPGDQTAGMGYLFVPVANLEAVAHARVDPVNWPGVSDGKGWTGAMVYTIGGESPDAHFHGRMFGPDVGITEDPATGSAAAMFPGQIIANEDLADGTHKWFVEQGYEMGRPSELHIEADVSGGSLCAVRVGGQAVWVSEGQITV